ncbi:helix-turn-helix domain-containing protein [Paraburkholderia unamae]|uniref:helix-turn-helix domain-containing protein n=1 Tax=Paraburkholderia unamae TaxID=219649 RepID=UPI003CC53C69
MDHIDLPHVFVRVVDRMKFTRAAETMGMPHPFVSATVLETGKAVGTGPLNRPTRRATMTRCWAVSGPDRRHGRDREPLPRFRTRPRRHVAHRRAGTPRIA